MNLQQAWEKALRETEIVRPRAEPLSVFESTQLPYIFLAESAVNHGDTVVRKGRILVEKPAIIMPSESPQFEGFDPDEAGAWTQSMLVNMLLVRGIKFPSFKYENKTQSLEVYEGKLKAAEQHYLKELQRKENLSTGLVVGPEDGWQFSVLIFTASQAIRQAGGDMKQLWERFRESH